jgi:hypothetical protein
MDSRAHELDETFMVGRKTRAAAGGVMALAGLHAMDGDTAPDLRPIDPVQRHAALVRSAGPRPLMTPGTVRAADLRPHVKPGGVAWNGAKHPRNRIGKFRDTPDAPKLMQDMTRDELRAHIGELEAGSGALPSGESREDRLRRARARYKAIQRAMQGDLREATVEYKRDRVARLRRELSEAPDGRSVVNLRAQIAVLERQIAEAAEKCPKCGAGPGKDGRCKKGHKMSSALYEALGHESLDRSPKKNWVERAGQLPAAIQHMAKDIHEERGLPLDQAIPIAISQAKKLAAKGNQKYVRAVAEWEALKAKNAAKKAAG